jgi:hypothetical protein
MVWTYRGRAVPLDVYHGVPRGWGAKQIVAEHARLGGAFDLTGPEATEPGAPAWLPERYSWLQYRQMLRRVGEGGISISFAHESHCRHTASNCALASSSVGAWSFV